MNLILDLSAVTRLDSSGLGSLVGNAKSIGSHGGAIWLAGPNDTIRRMLKITNLDKYFRIRNGVEDVLDELEGCVVSQTSVL
jgi:anti-sigma B factor antagonist